MSNLDNKITGVIVANMIISPPIVGVPDFSFCPSRPKSLIVSPTCFSFRYFIILLPKIVENKNLLYYQLKTQREFLLEMGINKRVENLSLNANQFERRDLLSGYERLVSKRQMGDIFKVNCFSNRNLEVPIFKL